MTKYLLTVAFSAPDTLDLDQFGDDLARLVLAHDGGDILATLHHTQGGGVVAWQTDPEDAQRLSR